MTIDPNPPSPVELEEFTRARNLADALEPHFAGENLTVCVRALARCYARVLLEHNVSAEQVYAANLQHASTVRMAVEADCKRKPLQWGRRIVWHPHHGGTKEVWGRGNTSELAFDDALVMAYRMGYTAPRWWQWWRWGEHRLVRS